MPSSDKPDDALPAADRTRCTYRFGPFLLDPAERRLLRGRTPIDLTPKVFDTLVVLVERAGHLVTKDELMQAVWPDTVVDENYLSVNVSKLRAALGETARDGRYIETVVGHGYRFRSGVEVLISGHADQGTVRPRMRRLLVPIGIALLILAGALVWSLLPSLETAPRSIAVLPLRTFPVPAHTSAPAETPAYLHLGIADAIISKLSHLDRLVVRPTSAVLAFQSDDTDPVEAGRALGVHTVLSGFIQQTDGALRLTMQLIDVAEARAIWSTSFEAPLTDVFVLQDTLATRVAQALALELPPPARSRLAANSTLDAEAYTAYLKGRYYWNQRTDESLRRSLTFYRAALDRDPTYAPGYLGLAETYSLLVWYSGQFPSHTFPQARAAARQALHLDSTLAEAYVTLAQVAWQYDLNIADAEPLFLHALSLKPNYAGAHHLYGQFLTLTGRFDEGLKHLQHALTLDPLSSAIAMDLASAHLFARRYDEARRQYERLLDQAPEFAVAYVFLGLAHELEGNATAALAAYEQALQTGGTNPLWLAEMARGHALAGDTTAAHVLLDNLQHLTNQRYVSPFSRALVHVALGQPEEALALLREAVETHDPYLIYLPVHPHLDPLRSQPGFTTLLRRLRLRPTERAPATPS